MMMRGQSHNEKKKHINILILLGTLVLISVFLLADRMMLVSGTTAKTVIELRDEGDKNTAGDIQLETVQTDTVQSRGMQSNGTQSGGMQSNGVQSGGAQSDGTQTKGANLRITDGQQVWSTDTRVNIFKISYKNGENLMTVAGADGGKVIAPGTSNTYEFIVSNSGDVALDYQLSVEAYFEDGEYTIPVTARFSDYNGTYFTGSETRWSPVLDLNQVSDAAVLAKNHYTRYILEWQWPYEGDDEYDTFLGNLAEEEEITLTVVIRTIATADENVDAMGGIPKTGDEVGIGAWIAGIVFSLAVICFLLLFVRREKGKPENDEE